MSTSTLRSIIRYDRSILDYIRFVRTRDAGENGQQQQERDNSSAPGTAGMGFRQVLREEQIRSLALRTDNMVTVFNLQRIGAGETLLHETRQIFSLLTQENIRLTVAHVPGIQNDLTDA
jgi:hypothetical protein